jgi:hypothetical protein
VAIYLNPTTGLHHQIMANQVAVFLPSITCKIFGIPTSHKDLLAWSCDFIWVMTANFLHCTGFSDSYIKNHLCWRSDTLLMYLHNTCDMASQHTEAITLGLDPPTPAFAHLLEPHKH